MSIGDPFQFAHYVFDSYFYISHVTTRSGAEVRHVKCCPNTMLMFCGVPSLSYLRSRREFRCVFILKNSYPTFELTDLALQSLQFGTFGP